MKIDFEFDTEYGVFRDALHLPDDQTFTDNEIELMKQERLNNWIAHITAPPVEILPEEQPVIDNPDDYIVVNGVQYKKVV